MKNFSKRLFRIIESRRTVTEGNLFFPLPTILFTKKRGLETGREEMEYQTDGSDTVKDPFEGIDDPTL
jgi:hypothetical protein